MDNALRAGAEYFDCRGDFLPVQSTAFLGLRCMARLSFSLVLVFLVACHVPSLLLAQGLSGSVGVGYAWPHTGGRGDSYGSQFNLSPGFNLDELSLVSRAQDGGETLSLTAWGFGGAEPTRRGHLVSSPGG